MTAAALIKTIHVGARALGLDADARHDLQLAATGKASLKDMDEADLQRVVDRMKAAGFNPAARARRAAAPRADLRLVHVLWRLLGEAGALDRPGREGLNAFVRSRFGEAWGAVPADVDMIRDAAKIEAVIAALKAWCRRAGVEVRESPKANRPGSARRP